MPGAIDLRVAWPKYRLHVQGEDQGQTRRVKGSSGLVGLPLLSTYSNQDSCIVVPVSIDLRGAQPTSGQAQRVGQVSFGGTLSIQYIVREQLPYIVVPGCIDLRGAWPKSELPVKAALVLLLCLSLCTCCYRLVQLLQLCRDCRGSWKEGWNHKKYCKIKKIVKMFIHQTLWY